MRANTDTRPCFQVKVHTEFVKGHVYEASLNRDPWEREILREFPVKQ